MLRRILLVLAVALVMAAMVVASAMPAFAKVGNCSSDGLRCSGGEHTGDVGHGGIYFFNPQTGFFFVEGGGHQGGGFGYRCKGSTANCVGHLPETPPEE